MKTILCTRNALGKIRLMEIVSTFDYSSQVGTIEKVTSQFGGKRTQQPTKTISKGKANRSVYEQFELELNSLINKSLNKGYKKVPNTVNIDSEVELDNFYPADVTDAKGMKKVMLAKDFNKCSSSTFEKPEYWLCSRKIDGIRCYFYYDEEKDEVLTSSRGGKEFNVATSHLRTDERMLNYFRKHQDAYIDGELYVHGKPLNVISGLSRIKDEEDTRYLALQFYIFDIMEDDMTAQERWDFVDSEIRNILEIGEGFNPTSTDKFKIVPQEEVVGWLQIKKKHDEYVGEDFEGCVIRNPDKKYKYNGRSNDMIKVKEYQDSEFEIIDYKLGARGSEDMTFTLKTSENKVFDASPMGDRMTKEDYVNNFSSIKGKYATVKFFYLSEYGIPQQPKVKTIRDYE